MVFCGRGDQEVQCAYGLAPPQALSTSTCRVYGDWFGEVEHLELGDEVEGLAQATTPLEEGAHEELGERRGRDRQPLA